MRIPVISIVSLLASLLLAPANGRADVEWTIAPYLWASDVGLDIVVNDDELVDQDVPFNNLVDKLDTALMVHFEAREDQWGGFLDVIYIELSDSRTISPGPGGPVVGDVTVDASLRLNIYEAAVLYRFGNAAPGQVEFDLFAGGRSAQIKVPLRLTIDTALPAPEVLEGEADISETDFLFGGRVLGYFSERWGYNLRADYSAGGSEGIFNAHAMIGYTFGQGLFTLNGGYRHMQLKFKDNIDAATIENDITMSGPVLGFVFNF